MKEGNFLCIEDLGLDNKLAEDLTFQYHHYPQIPSINYFASDFLLTKGKIYFSRGMGLIETNRGCETLLGLNFDKHLEEVKL